MANKSTTGQKHPYHLVDPSPLPFLSSIAGLAMAAGLVFYMHYGTSWLLILGTIGLLTIELLINLTLKLSELRHSMFYQKRLARILLKHNVSVLKSRL